MELEDKAKIVASVWGAKFVHFLAKVYLEETGEFILFFETDLGKTVSAASN